MAPDLNAARWRLVVLMSVVGLGGAVPAAIGGWGWKAAAGLTVGECLLAVAHAVYYRDGLIARLLLFGLVVGFGELPSDAYSVVLQRTLVYPAEGPMLWASPAYMPFSWMAVMVQMGFIAWCLEQRLGWVKATLVLALLGGAYVPVFEWLARSAQFWFYRDCWMLFGATPVYVIVAEALLCAALPCLLRRVEGASTQRVMGLAVAESAIVLAASVLAFWGLGRHG